LAGRSRADDVRQIAGRALDPVFYLIDTGGVVLGHCETGRR
jgi:hypothetical protein